MAKERYILGKEGEEEALNFLKAQGFRIIARNYRTKFAEIDIIAREKNTYCFIEVKARSTQRFGLAQESVNFIKQSKIAKAALLFLQENNLLESSSRFDVVAINNQDGKKHFQLIRDAFTYSE
ncbi:MAG: YraN family protein [Candidatus Omnitrophota bacterium]